LFFYYLRQVCPSASQGTNSGSRGSKVKTVRGSVFTAVSGTKQDFLRVCENKRAKKLCDC
jgi:hypothetical protein